MFKSNKLPVIIFIIVIAIFVIRMSLVRQPQIEEELRGKNGMLLTEVDISVCDPASGKFSSIINNPFFYYPVGKIVTLEGEGFKVQISSLDKTELVDGIETREIEEKEWKKGELSEISLNYYAQVPDGTVCYFGEAVDIYEKGEITVHDGSWRADEKSNKPGIIMTAGPGVGETYQQEVAPGVAEDRAEHIGLGQSFTTKAGTFADVLVVEETPPSTKRYARGIGLIFDDGAELTSY